ncbi:MAG: family 10 glycosylhydrolase [Bacteroidales bacterium]|nr:family 10 glycosylhydrolase [Bacteroidales bacterium]
MKKLFAIVSLIAIAISLDAQNVPQPKREFRGAWLHIVGNTQIRTMSEAQVKEMFIQTLDSLEQAGCNAVIFQVRPQADAFYPSHLEPWSRFLTGVQGQAPDPLWDPLQFMIEESHKRGMELHAWCNPYRVTSNDKEELAPDHLFFSNPDIFKRYGTQLYFDPGEPASREHTVSVIADIVRRYDVDAIHFDDYFYPYPVKYEEFHDDASFVKYAKEQGFEYWQKGDWRRNNVAILMKELNDTIKSIKPWVRFGISPFGIHRNLSETPDSSGSATNGLSNYEALFADVPDWGVKGYIDYIVPQLYWRINFAPACYEILINWWNDGNFTDHLYIGQNIAVLDTQLERKMELVRELPNVAGNVWWPGWSIKRNTHNIHDSLSTVYQSGPALIPAYTRLDDRAPQGVKTLKKKSTSVRWTIEPTDDPMQQPVFYAVYLFPKGVMADTSKGEYLVKITNQMSYDFREDFKKYKGYTVAVTAIDRCWNESQSFSLTL